MLSYNVYNTKVKKFLQNSKLFVKWLKKKI
jgi:hypothetical protein